MQYTTTCVSGYWNVVNKHGNYAFPYWFHTTLRINAPYVFFGTKETIETVKTYRKELPTHYIELEIKDFYTYQYKDKMLIDSIHCPSAELNIIWNEKVFLIEKAKQLNIFNTEFFAWIDAGVCTYRYRSPPLQPFPNRNTLSLLPKKKFIFTSSNKPEFEPNKLLTEHYHFISGTYILHIDSVDTIVSLYKEYIHKYMEPTHIYTDQIILTYIYRDHPHLFYQAGHGYGAILTILS
jgi:hypothetical protein